VTTAPEPLRLFAAEDGTPSGAGLEAPAESTRGQARGELLQAARHLSVAQTRFAKAVLSARQAGYSWRAVGRICGHAHQTLHRRFGQPDRNQRPS
jgi:hypothetical protein